MRWKPVSWKLSLSIPSLLLGGALVASAFSPLRSEAQCAASPARDHMTLAYKVSPRIDGDATTLHVTVTVQGAASDHFGLHMPGEASKDTVNPWLNLKAESPGTTLTTDAQTGERSLQFAAGKPVVFSYDLQKDWPGPLVHPRQFEPVIFPTYFELTGEKFLARPHINADEPVTAYFDWRALPPAWTLATSFGAGTDAASRCQSFTGMREALDEALFAGGDFRLHLFKVGARDVQLAIRGTWSFSDDEAAKQLVKPIQLARAFWHDDNFPYFLVTLAPFSGEGSTDGSAYTHAFWFFMGPKETLARPHIQKDLLHEAFHEWDPHHMGVQLEPQQASDWFQEGVTDYYADLLAYRGGLLPAGDYADAMNHGIADYAAHSKSDYVKGLVIGLWLDSVIRARSRGRRSLDDAMFDMVRHADQPLSEDRVLHTLDAYLLPADRELLRAAIDGDAALPLAGATIAAPCMQVVEEEVASFDLGLDFTKSKAAKVITGVEVDGPAYKAGLRDGQHLLSWSVFAPQTDKLQSYTIKDDEGERKLTYYAKRMLRAPKLRPQTENCPLTATSDRP